MNRRYVLAAVSEYFEEGSGLGVSADIEAHMRTCTCCQAHVRTLDRTITMVRRLGKGSVEEEIVVRLRSRIIERPDSGGSGEGQ